MKASLFLAANYLQNQLKIIFKNTRIINDNAPYVPILELLISPKICSLSLPSLNPCIVSAKPSSCNAPVKIMLKNTPIVTEIIIGKPI